MAQYQLKPQTVNAIQWKPGVVIAHAIEASDRTVYVHTATGKVKLVAGDYVIGTVFCQQTVMSSADFEARYEPVSEDEKPVPKKKPAKRPYPVTTKKTARKKATKSRSK